MTQYFDTHAHYDSGKFNADRSDVLRAVHESGVALIVDPGDCAATSARAVAIAQAYDFVYAAVGWHRRRPPVGRTAVWRKSARWHRSRKSAPSARSVWTITGTPPRRQRRRPCCARSWSLRWSWIFRSLSTTGRRTATVCALCATIRPLRGVFHCFSGSVEMARELLRRGWYLGFDGPITYKNAVKALDVIAACPADRMLLETDSPYLAPVPNRGKRNDSRNLPFIAARIAEIKGMTTEQVAEVTLQNGKQLFGI